MVTFRNFEFKRDIFHPEGIHGSGHYIEKHIVLLCNCQFVIPARIFTWTDASKGKQASQIPSRNS
jgi:hypothetical protein